MTRNIPKLFQGQPIIDKNGVPENWFVDAWNDLLDRTGGQTQDFVGNIINGTQELAAVNLAGVNLDERLVAIDQNIDVAAAEAASGTGGLVLTLSSPSAAGSRTGGGTVTTNAVVVTASGGTAPYSYVLVNDSGDTIANNHSGPTSNTVTFSETVSAGDTLGAVYRWDVTDSSGSPLTLSKSFNVYLFAREYMGGGIIP